MIDHLFQLHGSTTIWLLRIGMRSYSPTLMLWRPALSDTFGFIWSSKVRFWMTVDPSKKDVYEYHTFETGTLLNNFREMESDSLKIGFSYAVSLSKTQHY